MFSIIASLKKFIIASFFVLGAATTAIVVQSVATPETAEAGILKKGKKGLKLVGKGARFVEKKMAKKGKVGKFIAKGARGIRKGSTKAGRGISKVQKGFRKAGNKVCKGACRKVVKVGKKVKKAVNVVKRETERKCRQFGRNSKACKVAREALEFASPI